MNAWGYAEDSRDAGQWSDQALGQAEGRVRAQRCTAHLQIDPRATGATACGGGEVIAQGSRRSGAQIWAGGLTGLGAAGATGGRRLLASFVLNPVTPSFWPRR